MITYGFTYSSIDLLIEMSLLQLEEPRVIFNLRVGVVLNVHSRFLALGFLRTSKFYDLYCLSIFTNSLNNT